MGRERKLHLIGDDLTSVDWVYDFFEEGLQLLEQLLAKHAAFLDYLAAAERP